MTSTTDDVPMDVWLAVDQNGIPHFTEFNVQDEDGPLKIKLKR